jgi:hypothetical protein
MMSIHAHLEIDMAAITLSVETGLDAEALSLDM